MGAGGRGGRPDPAVAAAGSGGGAPGSAQAARSEQCGWLGALLGQCCHQPEVAEAELREPPAAAPGQRGQGAAGQALVEAPEPYFHANIRPASHPDSQQVGALPEPGPSLTGRGGAGPPEGGVAAAGPASGVLGAGGVGTFLVDNSILKIEGPPGVAYRYTKTRTDKVKSDVAVNVAKWGDLLQGVDEGDGWLRVGQFYLPMTHGNVPVITPLQGTPAAGAVLHHGGGVGTAQPRQSSSAPANSVPAALSAPGAVAATPPGARNGGLAAGAAREGTPTPEKQVAPDAEQDRDAQIAQDKKAARCGAAQPKPVATRAAAFPLMPSVGSWLLPLPQPWPAKLPPRPQQALEGRFEFLPSVGTWLFRRMPSALGPPADEKTPPKLLKDGGAQVGSKV